MEERFLLLSAVLPPGLGEEVDHGGDDGDQHDGEHHHSPGLEGEWRTRGP